jgi:hypothetical protein
MPTFAHYSVVRKHHWQIDETTPEHEQSMENFCKSTSSQKKRFVLINSLIRQRSSMARQLKQIGCSFLSSRSI